MLFGGTEQDSLSQADVIANLYIFFLAGHETTATAFSTAVAELADKQEIQQRLFEEITANFGTEPPSFESIHNDPPDFLNRFLLENLRKHPPVELLPTRHAKEDIAYGDQVIPAGSLVMFNIRTIHNHPEHWEEPEKFDPDRFLPERKKGRHKFAYLPFSLGQRQCIGNEFSELEQRLVLIRLLQRFKIVYPQKQPKKDLKDYLPFGKVIPSWIHLERR